MHFFLWKRVTTTTYLWLLHNLVIFSLFLFRVHTNWIPVVVVPYSYMLLGGFISSSRHTTRHTNIYVVYYFFFYEKLNVNELLLLFCLRYYFANRDANSWREEEMPSIHRLLLLFDHLIGNSFFCYMAASIHNCCSDFHRFNSFHIHFRIISYSSTPNGNSFHN